LPVIIKEKELQDRKSTIDIFHQKRADVKDGNTAAE